MGAFRRRKGERSAPGKLSAADTAGLPVARVPKKERQVDAMRHVCSTPGSTATDEGPGSLRIRFAWPSAVGRCGRSGHAPAGVRFNGWFTTSARAEAAPPVSTALGGTSPIRSARRCGEGGGCSKRRESVTRCRMGESPEGAVARDVGGRDGGIAFTQTVQRRLMRQSKGGTSQKRNFACCRDEGSNSPTGACTPA